VFIGGQVGQASAFASPPNIKITVTPASGFAVAAMQTPLDAEGVSPPAAVAYTGALAPAIRVAVAPVPSGAVASASQPFYGGNMLAYLVAAANACAAETSVAETLLSAAEAVWAAAVGDVAIAAAQDTLDKRAALLTYCGESEAECTRAVELAHEYLEALEAV
jgi:hypothetical protein